MLDFKKGLHVTPTSLHSPSAPQLEVGHSKQLLLSKEEIMDLLSRRELVVEPVLNPKQIDSVSIDLRLGNVFGEFRTARMSHIDPARIEQEYKDYLEFITLEPMRDVYYLQPKQFALAQTFEYVALPNYISGSLEGKSSIARQGLTVHAAAGLIDPGFTGHLVFELLNAGQMPLKLCPLMRVAKIAFLRCNVTSGYKGTFRMQVGIRPPKNDLDVKAIGELKSLLDEKGETLKQVRSKVLRAVYST
jgi:dCTP deaminase